MNKFYNTIDQIATNICNFLIDIGIKRKTQLNIIPFIVIGMILSESTVRLDIAKNLKSHFFSVKLASIKRRISRFFKNKLFNPYSFYDLVIRHVIKTYKKKHSDNRVHIIFDHMFSHDNFTVFMFSMRIGKIGIPLWFRCFRGTHDPDAFCEDILIEGISYVSSLFDPSFKLIFLADRWFNSSSLFKHISSLGHSFAIRAKGNIKVFIYDKSEGFKVWKNLNELFAYQYHSNIFYDLEITEAKFKVNIAISKKQGVKEPWIILTNDDPKRAIKDYGYRFGGIETLFKNQKSNGFYLESVCNASLEYFTSMYTITCFSYLFLTILGADYSKNTKCYKDVDIETHTIINGTKARIMSLFNTGLTLFHIAFNSPIYIRIPYHFILYDI